MRPNTRITCVALLLMASPIGWNSRALAEDSRSKFEHHESADHKDGNNGEGSSSNSSSEGTGSTNSNSAGSGSAANNQGSNSSSVNGIASNGTAISGSTSIGGTSLSKLPVMDPEQTKDAVKAGGAASMPLLLTYLKQNYPGEVLDVKLHEADVGYVYEVRYLANTIFLHTLYLDAQTLKIK